MFYLVTVEVFLYAYSNTFLLGDSLKKIEQCMKSQIFNAKFLSAQDAQVITTEICDMCIVLVGL